MNDQELAVLQTEISQTSTEIRRLSEHFEALVDQRETAMGNKENDRLNSFELRELFNGINFRAYIDVAHPDDEMPNECRLIFRLNEEFYKNEGVQQLNFKFDVVDGIECELVGELEQINELITLLTKIRHRMQEINRNEKTSH